MLRLEQVKELARQAGFDAAGVAPVALLSEEVKHLQQWVAAGKQGDMEYLSRNMEIRENPALLVEGACSVIVTLINYYTAYRQSAEVPHIARYAWGKDYHHVVKGRLRRLLQLLQQEEPSIRGRCFTDSAPVLEHEWARRAGLGWQGKHTLLIRKGYGSFCFIGILITTAACDRYDTPFTNSFCGNCQRCIQACPTGALTPYELDARKCISYQTIENRGEYPVTLKRLAGKRIFGCEACQDACPWNKNLQEHTVPEFQPVQERLNLSEEAWRSLSEERFLALFGETPLKRTGLMRILRNLPGEIE